MYCDSSGLLVDGFARIVMASSAAQTEAAIMSPETMKILVVLRLGVVHLHDVGREPDDDSSEHLPSFLMGIITGAG
ncbi:hypothetical protein NL676_023887 [Syzygium grande]|nr:hypothetical protein NL676_023887 [Syzygium grande]